MKLCIVCNQEINRPRSNICLKCYQINYRLNNKEICYQRSRKSQLKRCEYYRIKRRENYRKKHGISLDDPFEKRKDGEGNIDSNGYKTITKRGHPNQMDAKGRIREHVFVMSEYLERPLTKNESVHHKNGDRLDNRIENLELWHKGQPAGQRIEDKIKWCIEFLNEYGYKVEKYQ
jgi:HNH endonuclease